MRYYQDVIYFHKEGKFYGYTTYGKYIEDKARYDKYLSDKQLNVAALEFIPYSQELSPLGKRTRKAVEYLLFSTEVELDEHVRKSIYNITKFDFILLQKLITNVTERVAEIYQRSLDEEPYIVDLNRYTGVLMRNIATILKDLEG